MVDRFDCDVAIVGSGFGGAVSALRLADPEDLAAGDHLGPFLERLVADFTALSDVLTRDYLSHLGPERTGA